MPPKSKEKAAALPKKQVPNVIDLVVSEQFSSNAGKKVAGSGKTATQTRSSIVANTSSFGGKKGTGKAAKGKIPVTDDDDEWMPEDFNPVPKGEPKLLKRKFSDTGSMK